MSNPSRQVALLSALVLGVNALLVAAPANAVTVWGQDWQLNGDATQNPPEPGTPTSIVLTPDEGDKVGSAWVLTPLSVTDESAFSASFEFRISGSNGPGDGMAFVMHGGDADALGAGGSGLGYDGLGSNFLAVEFDTFDFNDPDDPDSETVAPHVAIQLNDSDLFIHPSERVAAYPSLVRDSGDPNLFAWVDFDPNNNTLSVFLSESNVKPVSALLFYDLSDLSEGLASLIGSEIRFGFTAGTGAAYSQHEVFNFSTTPVPLPAAVWLLLSGLCGLGFVGRRRAAA